MKRLKAALLSKGSTVALVGLIFFISSVIGKVSRIIVDAMQSECAKGAVDEREAVKNESMENLAEVRAFRSEVAALRGGR